MTTKDERRARVAELTRRINEIDGAIMGFKPDKSEAAQAERGLLVAERTAITAINSGEAGNGSGNTSPCEHCPHNGAYHHYVIGGRCYFPSEPEESCDCIGFNYILPPQR